MGGAEFALHEEVGAFCEDGGVDGRLARENNCAPFREELAIVAGAGTGSLASMKIDLSAEIRELELGKEDLDQVDGNVLVLVAASRLGEQALREVARQMALVAGNSPAQSLDCGSCCCSCRPILTGWWSVRSEAN